jgi:hypothetical protein
MKPMLFLAVFLLIANVAGAQPVPLPHDAPPGSSVTTYDAQGRGYTTSKTPTGWVTYGLGGERFDTFEKYSGGTVTYGPGGEKWETFPGPATPSRTMPLPAAR